MEGIKATPCKTVFSTPRWLRSTIVNLRCKYCYHVSLFGIIRAFVKLLIREELVNPEVFVSSVVTSFIVLL